jgi:hypothetical protein
MPHEQERNRTRISSVSARGGDIGDGGCGRLRPPAPCSDATRWLECAAYRDQWRFAPDADRDPATGTPVGDEGYFLYVLTEAANWDFSDGTSLLLSMWQRPWAHAWIILESPRNRLELGHTGDFGLEKPRYYKGRDAKGSGWGS